MKRARGRSYNVGRADAKSLSARRGCGRAPRAAGRPGGRRAARAPRRGSRQPSRPGSRHRCRAPPAPHRASSASVSPPRPAARGASPVHGGCRARRRRTPRSQRRCERRDVELLVVRQHDDRGVAVGADLRERRLGPFDDDLVGARDALRGRVFRAAHRRRSCANRPLRGGAERLAGVDGADDDETRRRAEHLGEDLQAPRARAWPFRCTSRASTASPSGSSPTTSPRSSSTSTCAPARSPSTTVKSTARSSP